MGVATPTRSSRVTVAWGRRPDESPRLSLTSRDQEVPMQRWSSFIAVATFALASPASAAEPEKPSVQKEVEQAQKQAGDAFKQAQKAQEDASRRQDDAAKA